MSLKSRTVIQLVLFVLLLALLAAAGLLWHYRQPGFSAEPFDASAWKAAAPAYGTSGDPACVRGGMAQDLIERQLLIGKSAPQVLELLGEPVRRGARAWAYELGPCSGWGWSDSELLLEFDAGGTQVLRAVFQHLDPG